jgi:putative membrane protein
MATNKRTALLSLATAGLLLTSRLGPVFADDSDDNQGPSTEQIEDLQLQPDQDFLFTAISGNYTEIAAGNLALQRSTNPQVRQFAQMLIQDHMQQNNVAIPLAESLGMEPPTGPAEDAHLSLLQTLENLAPADFDRYFSAEMQLDHRTDIAEYQDAVRDLEKPVADFADESLPVLENHLSMANQVAQQLNAPNLADNPEPQLQQ